MAITIDTRTATVGDLDAALERMEQAAIARDDFYEFCRYTQPQYQYGRHHRVMASAMQNWLFGEPSIAIVSIPPRYSKSTFGSILLPAWAYGKRPDMKIMGASYAAPLSRVMNRGIQSIMTTERYDDVFPRVKLAEDFGRTSSKFAALRNSDYFDVIDGNGADACIAGSYKNVGVGGGATGFGMEAGIIDDPVKGWEQANSPTIQRKQWDWFNSEFLTRFNPGCPIRVMLIMTRWHENDLAGRILQSKKDFANIVELNLPALYDGSESEYDWRTETDEPLWDGSLSVEDLKRIRKRSPYQFSALYQGQPRAPKDCVFNPATIQYHTDDDIRGRTLILFAAFDPAISKSKTADFSAYVCIGVDMATGDIFVLDAFRDKLGVLEQIDTIFAQTARRTVQALGVETIAYQKALAELLQREAATRRDYTPIIEIATHGNKVMRISRRAPLVQQGVIKIRESHEDLRREMEEFRLDDSHAHDDLLDALDMAITLATEAQAYSEDDGDLTLEDCLEAIA